MAAYWRGIKALRIVARWQAPGGQRRMARPTEVTIGVSAQFRTWETALAYGDLKARLADKKTLITAANGRIETAFGFGQSLNESTS